MVKRVASRSESELEADGIDITAKASYNSNRVVLRSRFPAHLRVQGPVTGELVECFKAGDTVEVDALDVQGLLEMTVGKSVCCGSSGRNYMFELA